MTCFDAAASWNVLSIATVLSMKVKYHREFSRSPACLSSSVIAHYYSLMLTVVLQYNRRLLEICRVLMAVVFHNTRLIAVLAWLESLHVGLGGLENLGKPVPERYNQSALK